MRVELSALADRDLEDIDLQTIERFGFQQAIRTANEFDQAIDLIGENPGIGREREDLSQKDRPLRTCPIMGQFLIVYEVREEVVIIQRILVGTRDLNKIFDNPPGEG
jgi:plasmid stabilization system protein ParE